MLFDGIKLYEGSDIQNLSVNIGSFFPANANKGELFYSLGVGEGLYVFDGTDWQLIADKRTISKVLAYTPANVAGDTFTGPVILSGNPTANLGAATKQYVDVAVASASSSTSTQYSTLTGIANVYTAGANTRSRILSASNLTIALPTGGTDGALAYYWINNTSASSITVTLDPAIIIPSTTTFTSPVSLTAATKSRLVLEYDSTHNNGLGAWELATYIGGYKI